MRGRRALKEYFRKAVQSAPYRPLPARPRAPGTRGRGGWPESLSALAAAAGLALWLLLPPALLPRPLERRAAEAIGSVGFLRLTQALRQAIVQDPPFKRLIP